MTQQLRLNPRWLSSCDESDKEEIQKRLIENQDLLLILDKILVQKLDANSTLRRSKKAYDKPAFSEFQADCNAVERTLDEIRTYLKITKEK